MKHIQILFFSLFFLYGFTATAAPAVTLSYFIWPATDYRAASSEEGSYCSLILEEKTIEPTASDLERIDATVKLAKNLLDAFREEYKKTGHGLSDALETQMNAVTIELSDLRNEFGFELGLQKEYSILFEDVGCLVLTKGFIPTKEELAFLESTLKKQIEAGLADPSKITDESLMEMRWNLSMLQKLEGNYKVFHSEKINNSRSIAEAFFKLKDML